MIELVSDFFNLFISVIVGHLSDRLKSISFFSAGSKQLTIGYESVHASFQ